MASTAILDTYGDVSIKTDVVLNSIEYISAKENGIFSMLGTTNAISMVHSYSVDTYATAGSLAVAQGADFTFGARTTPTLLTNLIEEIAQPVAVTRPQIEVQHFHGENEMERQLAKGLVEFSNAAEFDLVRSTLVSGVSGTVAKMSGIIEAISKSTNTTAHTSGTVFSATILDGLMSDCWTNSNGDVATDIFVGGVMKRIMDSFIQKSNVVVNSADIRGIVKTVTTYETSFGTVTIHKHRYVQQSADATGRILAIRGLPLVTRLSPHSPTPLPVQVRPRADRPRPRRRIRGVGAVVLCRRGSRRGVRRLLFGVRRHPIAEFAGARHEVGAGGGPGGAGRGEGRVGELDGAHRVARRVQGGAAQVAVLGAADAQFSDVALARASVACRRAAVKCHGGSFAIRALVCHAVRTRSLARGSHGRRSVAVL